MFHTQLLSDWCLWTACNWCNNKWAGNVANKGERLRYKGSQFYSDKHFFLFFLEQYILDPEHFSVPFQGLILCI